MVCYFDCGRMGQGVLSLDRTEGPPWCGKCTRNLAILAYVGHRTYSMLRGQYWWTDILVDAYVKRSEVCDWIRSSFNTLLHQLLPFLIIGQGYRWSLDFIGPLVVTPCGAKYVLVMVEHLASGLNLSLYLKTLQSCPRQPFWIVCWHVLEHRLRY